MVSKRFKKFEQEIDMPWNYHGVTDLGQGYNHGKELKLYSENLQILRTNPNTSSIFIIISQQ